jgi:DNA-binding transcriptional MerR regulator
VSEELLTAGAAARRLGVAVTTLRSWHQRYGLGPSAHEPGHHRRYTADDMARLVLMQELVTAGVTPAEAARWARQAPLPESEALGTVADASPPVSMATRDGGGGHALALGDADPAARGVGRAALRLDVLRVRQLAAEALEKRGIVDAWDEVLRPVLVAVGERTASTGELIEVEHLLSGCISASFAALPRPPRSTPVRLLLACADEEQHSLPIEALAAALAQRGIPARVLGARVPGSALRAAVRRTGPVAVLIWSQVPETGNPAQLEQLLAVRGRPALVAAGGSGWDPATLPPGVVAPACLKDAVELFQAAAFS